MRWRKIAKVSIASPANANGSSACTISPKATSFRVNGFMGTPDPGLGVATITRNCGRNETFLQPPVTAVTIVP